MSRFILIGFILFLLFACKTNPNADKIYVNSKEDKIYKLRLNPVPGSYYKFDIKNETELKMEVDDKKIENINHTSFTVGYQINRDSTGNIDLRIRYDKVHIYSKSGDVETDVDAANAGSSINPLEKMLGILTEAPLEASILKTGEVKSVRGYKELGAKLMSGMDANDPYSRNLAQTQWNQVIEQGLIKRNMNELFSIFPDSAIHIGDKWKTSSKQKSDIPLNVQTTYRLKEINDGIALIEEEAAITGDSGSFYYQGAEVTMDLNGEEEGEFQMDIKTGMLVNCDKHSRVKGTIEMTGREIPVHIATRVSINMLKP